MEDTDRELSFKCLKGIIMLSTLPSAIQTAYAFGVFFGQNKKDKTE